MATDSTLDPTDPETPTPQSDLDRCLLACLEHDDASRAAVLDRLCEERPELASSLRARLAFLERIGLTETAPAPESIPEEFGDFRLLTCLGRGGMGVVYLAEQKSLGRRVALKLIRADYLHFPGSRERFRREALAASRLDHPNVCPVYEAGETKGVPYIAMRYVEGETLAQRIAEARKPGGAPPDAGAVIAMGEKLARALHAAHEAGLVHRDIKPGNVLVAKDGEPVILDFGLARDNAELAGLTQGSDPIGTPAYMSPEQVTNPASVDRRSDVYSLGIVLRECLTLERPFGGVPGPQLYRQILEGSAEDSAGLRRRAPRDLRTVLAKATDRDRERRYATALELAEDLRCVRQHRPIHARSAGPALRLQRWTQRHPALAAFVVVMTVSLVVALLLLRHAASLAGARQAAQVRGSDPLRSLRLARDAYALEENPDTVSELHASFAVVRQVRCLRQSGYVYGARFLPGDERLLIHGDGGTATLWPLLAGGHPKILDHRLPAEDGYPTGRVPTVLSAVFPDIGHPILTLPRVGQPRLWTGQGELTRMFDEHHTDQAWWLASAISGDGRSILLGGQSGQVVYYPRGIDAERLELLTAGGSLGTLAFSADGQWLAAADNHGEFPPLPSQKDYRVWIWSRQGEPKPPLRGHTQSIASVSFADSPGDGIWLLTASHDNTCRTWDLRGQQIASFPHGGPVHGACFAPDGRVLSWSRDCTARLWTRHGRLLRTMPHPAPVAMARISADGQRIATACGDGIVRIFDGDGRELLTLAGHATHVTSVSFSADRRLLATASADWTARVFLLEREDLPVLLGHTAGVTCVVRSGEGELVTAGKDHTLRRWDIRTGREVGLVVPLPSLQAPTHLDLSPDGDEILVSLGWQQALRFGRDGKPRGKYCYDTRGYAYFVARYADADRMLAAGYRVGARGEVDLVELATNTPVGKHRPCSNNQIADLQMAPGHPRRYALAGLAPQAWVVDFATGRVTSECAGYHDQNIVGLAFTPDGRLLTGSLDGKAGLWDVAANPARLLARFEGHTAAVTSVCVSPDGRRVATTSRDGTARLWSIDGREITTLCGHQGPVWSAVFSADGKRLFTAGEDAAVRTWIVETRELIERVDGSEFLGRTR